MPRREYSIVKDADGVARLVRALDASVNVAILAELLAARKKPEAGGWLMLSDLARRLGQSPGTVSVGIQKMLPVLVEDKYDRGRRYFRSRVASLAVVLED